MGKAPGPEISRARWAGVALVVAALLAAISLAIVSPSQGDAPGVAGAVEGSAAPSSGATVLDTRRPVGEPEITSPKDGAILAERRIDVVVDVPEETLTRRNLTLVVLRDGTEVAFLEKPETGGLETVPDVPLVAGPNALTAALKGPGGLTGPVSAPVTVTQDLDAPVLRITSPATNSEVFEETVIVTGTSEPGVSVKVRNEANDFDRDAEVSPRGTFEVSVELAPGRNRIEVSSIDSASLKDTVAIVVIRKDAKPRIAIGPLKPVSRSSLPRSIRVVVDVTDPSGDALEGATVWYSLRTSGWRPQDLEDVTDADGRSVFDLELVPDGPGSQEGSPTLVVEVIAPNDERSQKSLAIAID